MRSKMIALDTPDSLRAGLFGQQVKVQIANLNEAHQQAAAGLPFVKSVTVNGQTLLVDAADPDANNPALIAALVGAGAQVQYVQATEATLEDVYMELVNGGQG